MRSWHPIPASSLDNKRLLAEHNELLIMARTIAGVSKGWPNHPETKRWRGHSKAMKKRHDEVAEEMLRRGMKHKSPWPEGFVISSDTEDFPEPHEPLDIMLMKLEDKIGKKLCISLS